ncbi:hypothetical protein [Spirillospora sp. CA-294931]|uniref:hypothetical protein n=1 Tax=Spirillospora sp. CA-294931 TaxID=3240042 RepID=UPI003D936431
MRTSDDPYDEPPRAMQLVVRAEKAAPPGHGAVCAAAARAVVALLTDPRTTDPEGEWHDAVRRWEDGRIRKVARRARGVRWPEVQALPGVTVEQDGAEVRAFVPGSVADVPPEISKLQVAGLDLADEEEPKPPPEPPYAVIALNPGVAMTTGKAAAQSGHAAHLLLRQAGEPGLAEWIGSGPRVHLVRDLPWHRCVEHAAVAVRDAGFTEVPPGTMTAVAWLRGASPARG